MFEKLKKLFTRQPSKQPEHPLSDDRVSSDAYVVTVIGLPAAGKSELFYCFFDLNFPNLHWIDKRWTKADKKLSHGSSEKLHNRKTKEYNNADDQNEYTKTTGNVAMNTNYGSRQMFFYDIPGEWCLPETEIETNGKLLGSNRPKFQNIVSATDTFLVCVPPEHLNTQSQNELAAIVREILNFRNSKERDFRPHEGAVPRFVFALTKADHYGPGLQNDKTYLTKEELLLFIKPFNGELINTIESLPASTAGYQIAALPKFDPYYGQNVGLLGKKHFKRRGVPQLYLHLLESFRWNCVPTVRVPKWALLAPLLVCCLFGFLAYRIQQRELAFKEFNKTRHFVNPNNKSDQSWTKIMVAAVMGKEAKAFLNTIDSVPNSLFATSAVSKMIGKNPGNTVSDDFYWIKPDIADYLTRLRTTVSQQIAVRAVVDKQLKDTLPKEQPPVFFFENNLEGQLLVEKRLFDKVRGVRSQLGELEVRLETSLIGMEEILDTTTANHILKAPLLQKVLEEIKSPTRTNQITQEMQDRLRTAVFKYLSETYFQADKPQSLWPGYILRMEIVCTPDVGMTLQKTICDLSDQEHNSVAVFTFDGLGIDEDLKDISKKSPERIADGSIGLYLLADKSQTIRFTLGIDDKPAVKPAVKDAFLLLLGACVQEIQGKKLGIMIYDNFGSSKENAIACVIKALKSLGIGEYRPKKY